MRYAAIISMILIFSACGNKISTLKFTGEKVSKAVNTCTEAAKTVCTEVEKVDVNNISMNVDESYFDKTEYTLDAHLMLW